MKWIELNIAWCATDTDFKCIYCKLKFKIFFPVPYWHSVDVFLVYNISVLLHAFCIVTCFVFIVQQSAERDWWPQGGDQQAENWNCQADQHHQKSGEGHTGTEERDSRERWHHPGQGGSCSWILKHERAFIVKNSWFYSLLFINIFSTLLHDNNCYTYFS